MATRPVVVTPQYAAAITEATVDLAERIRVLAGNTTRGDDGHDQAAKLAEDYITSLCRRGWRPTSAAALPDWRSSRRQPPDVARRGAASARELLGQSGRDVAEPGADR